MAIFLDAGYVSLNKYGEELCGDNVEIIRGDNNVTCVLADGLGSGVKANILSTLTSKIICMLAANELPLEECVSTIVSTLPVCNVRKVAYSTFTLVHVDLDGTGYLVEFDNPLAIMLKDGKFSPLERKEKIICGKKIFITELKLEPEDVIVFTSDGVVHAGIGAFLNFGWERKEIIEYLEHNYSSEMSPRCIASLVGDACKSLYASRPGDDTTIAAIKVREEVEVDMMVGPPVDKNDDERLVRAFLNMDSKKIVCGGTTSQIVARTLGVPVETNLDYFDPFIPPTGIIKGIDLTTEGVITLGKLLELAKTYLDISDVNIKQFKKKDGASQLAQILFEEATSVRIYVGRSVNIAHQGLPIDTSMKLKIVEKLQETLKKLGKNVVVNYY